MCISFILLLFAYVLGCVHVMHICEGRRTICGSLFLLPCETQGKIIHVRLGDKHLLSHFAGPFYVIKWLY